MILIISIMCLKIIRNISRRSIMKLENFELIFLIDIDVVDVFFSFVTIKNCQSFKIIGLVFWEMLSMNQFWFIRSVDKLPFIFENDENKHKCCCDNTLQRHFFRWDDCHIITFWYNTYLNAYFWRSHSVLDCYIPMIILQYFYFRHNTYKLFIFISWALVFSNYIYYIRVT